MQTAKHLILIILAIITPSATKAQGDVEYKMEIGGGVGLINYLGDLNGNLLSNLQPMAALTVRRVFNPYMALRANLSYGTLKGKYDETQTYYPISETKKEFSNSVFDLTGTYEYNFWPYGTGREYRHAKRLVPYIFLGIGVTMAKTRYNTEFTGNIPMGLGVKYKVGDRLNMSLDWGMHFSFSDNLDGIVDPYKIKRQGAFKNTDCYSMLQLTLTYSFAEKCSTCNPDH